MMGSNTQNRKNASGSRSDIGWEHGIEVEKNPMKIKCKYCNEIIPGNIYRFKHHLASTKKDVKACNSVPVEVKEQMFRQLKESSKRKMINDEEEEMVESVPRKRGKKVIESFSNRTIGTSQSAPNQNFEKRLRDEACQQIARFFHTSGIPFNCAKNPEFAKMLELVGKCGSEFAPPPYHELENSFVENEMKNTTDMLEKYKYEWKKTGCSIICDEWTDMKGGFYCNFLVNSPMGTVFFKSIDTSDFLETIENVFNVLDEIVEKVGEENVVQVITNNAANYEAAVEQLIEKRNKILWSPCIVQLLDEILEDFEKNLSHHRITIAKGKKITKFIYSSIQFISMLKDSISSIDLIGPTTTPSASAYLTLLYLINIKEPLMEMFSLDEWESEVYQIVQDCEFWNDIVDCLKFALPIIEVLLKIDSDEKPTMGFIYEEMRGAQKSIQSLNNVKGFETIWKIINERWNPRLHPQYLASYILNPQFHYYDTFEFPYIYRDPVYYITGMLFDPNDNLDMTEENELKIKDQFEEFSNLEFFESPTAIIGIHTKDPAKWWNSYGNDWPQLQRIAIRLLSLTCSSCGSGQIRNAYEQVYPKKRSHSYQKKLNDLFVGIQKFKSYAQQARTKTLLEDIPEVLPSVTENEVGEVSGAKKNMLVNVDVDGTEGVPLPGNYSGNEVDTFSHNIQPQSSAPGMFVQFKSLSTSALPMAPPQQESNGIGSSSQSI